MSKPTVFISYTHDDADWAREFAEALRKQNVNVWLDQWQIAIGEPIRDAIEIGLRESDIIVAVMSPRNIRNPNVFFELGAALGMGKRLIPIVSKDLEISAIPFDLRIRRYLIKGSPDDAAREVAAAVKGNE